jgi:chromosomal replication initiation ATPase DnaA
MKPTQEEYKIIDKVEKCVCRHFGVSVQSIINNDKTSQASLARGYIMYVLHVDFSLSISKIAYTYQRTTRAVFWHVEKIKSFLKQRIYKDIYNEICTEVKK